MTSSTIHFTPIYGAGEHEPFCSLLQIDDCKILLDCGWDERFDESMLAPLRKIIPELNCVLLSHPNLPHLGALPYIVGKLGLTAPIYCTKPVWEMGQMFLYDAFLARNKYEFDLFDLEDVDAAFVKNKKAIKLGYQETIALSDTGDGISITPFQAGHLIGGTVWKIVKEHEEIVYAVDYNHTRERHIEAGLLEVCTSRPTALISDSYNATSTQEKRNPKIAEFNTAWLGTLRAGGNVLIPCDAAGRVLELFQVLHHHWREKHLSTQTYSVAFLGDESAMTLDFARKQLSWMSEALNDMFNREKESPFMLKELQCCHSMADLDRLKKPFVCFATSETMGGYSQDVFLKLAADSRNLVLLTFKTPPWTLAGKLLEAQNDIKGRRLVTFARRENKLLEGEEKARALEERRVQQEQRKLDQHLDLEEDSESDDEMGVPGVARKLLVPKFPMYPCVEAKSAWTAYGEAIHPDDYKIADETAVQAKAKDLDIAMLEVDEEGPPQKTITKIMTVEVHCSVKFVNLEGRAAGDSMQKIIAKVEPSKLILIHGSEVGKSFLANICKENVKNLKDVMIPENGQCVDATSGQRIFRIQLTEPVMKSLQFSKINDEYDIAYVEGALKVNYSESPLPMLTTSNESGGHNDVFVGNLNLSDLKRELTRNGLKATIIETVLVCSNGAVNIRKVGATNQISIQGCLCEDYYKIRSILYGLYKIV